MAKRTKVELHILKNKHDGVYLDEVRLKGVRRLNLQRSVGEVSTVTIEMYVGFEKKEDETDFHENMFMQELKDI